MIEKILWYLFSIFIGLFLIMATSFTFIVFVKVMYNIIYHDKLFL